MEITPHPSSLSILFTIHLLIFVLFFLIPFLIVFFSWREEWER